MAHLYAGDIIAHTSSMPPATTGETSDSSQSALERNRTSDTFFRREVLYPLSYQGGRARPHVSHQ